MATRTINTRIALEGDAAYKTKLKDINSQYSLLKSELAKLRTESAGAANSEENLQKKVDLLTRAKQNLTEKLSLYNERLHSAQTVQENYSQKVASLREKIEQTTRQQEDLGDVTEETAEEHERLSQELQRYQQELQRAEEGQRRADESVQRWQTQVNNAEVSVSRLSDELEENERYLQEASQSNDHMAHSIDEYGHSVQEAADDTENFGERSGNAIDALAACIAASGLKDGLDKIKDALLSCIEASGQFETAVAKVGTIADTNALPLDELRSQIINLSNDLGVSAAEISESTYSAISASVETANAVGFVEQATKLAAGGFTDTTTAVDILSTAINAYGLETSQASQLADYLITTQNLGKTSVAELAVNMGKVIPIAAAYNVEMDNLSSAYAVLTANGIATAESTTYLKSMLNELGDSGSVVSATLQESTGKSFATLTQEGKSLGDVIEILGDSVNGDTGAFNELWSSSEAGVGALSLLGSGAEKYNSVLEQMQQSTGATDKAFATMTDTVEYSKQKMETAFENMKVAIGDELTPAIQNMSDIGAGAFTWATDFVKEYPEVVTAVTAVAIGLGTLVTAVTAVTTATTIATKVWSSFTKLVAKHPLVKVAIAIATAASMLGAFAALTAQTVSAEEELQKKSEELKVSVDEIIQSYSEAKEETQQNTEANENLASELSRLIGQEEKTAETKKRIQEIVGILNNEVPELSLAYDEQTDSLNMTIAALDAYLDKQAREQEYDDAVKERTELLKKRAEASGILQEAEENLTEAEDAYNAALEDNGEATAVTQGELTQLNVALVNSKTAYEGAQEALNLIEAELQNSEGIIADHQLSVAGMSETVIAERDALLEAAAAFGENSAECQEVRDAIAALDEQYIIHTTELKARVDEIREQQEQLRTEHENTKQKIHETLTSEMGMYEEVSIKGYDSIEKLISSMDSQISYMDTYAANIQAAMDLGVDEGIVQTLSDGSIDSAKILQAIVDDGGEHIDEFNATFKKVEEGRATFEEELAEIQDGFSEAMAKLEEELGETIYELNKSGEAYEAGMDTVRGFIKGSNNPELKAELIGIYKDLASAAISAARSTLKQRSPSRVFREIGQYNVIGAIQGTEEEKPRLERTYARTASAAIEAYNTQMDDLIQNMQAQRYAEYFAMPSAMQQSGEIRLPDMSSDSAITRVLERLSEVLEQRGGRSGITQNVTIVNPEGTPAANARALRKVERGLAFGL